jgi:tRNA (guanine37-N1)-methyltransferase
VKIHILTLFPEFFDGFVSHSILKRAIEKGAVTVEAHDLRRWTHDRHKTADDKPFGGGPGMLMKPEPVFEAVGELFPKWKDGKAPKSSRFIYMTPAGERFTQKKAKELAQAKEIVFLCGHYEGVDQRVIDGLATDEISIGDYVLTGGELPAMVVVDTVIRHLKGVLGKEESKEVESFSGNLLEYPQYTRPAVYRGLSVPSVLLSGNHKEIELWRQEEALKRTLARRPDLLKT